MAYPQSQVERHTIHYAHHEPSHYEDFKGPQHEQYHHDYDPEDRDVEQLEHDIRQTRASMDRTIDQLIDRLAPRQLMEDAIHRVTGSDSKEIGQSARELGKRTLRELQEHPYSAVLIGAGLALMFYEQRQARKPHIRQEEPEMYGGSYVDTRTGEPYRSDYGHESSGQGTKAFGRQAIEKTHQAREQARQVAGQIGQAAGQAKQAASKVGQQVRQSVADTADQVRHSTQAAGRQLRDTVSYSRDRISETMERNPLAVGAIMAGIGMAIGLLIPESRKEHQLLGKQADEVKKQVRQAGQETLQRGQQVVSAGTAAAAQEAQRQAGEADRPHQES